MYLLSKILSNGIFEDAESINSLLRYPQDESMVEMLIVMFIVNEDVAIRHAVLNCFQTLFYYGESVEDVLR